MLLISVDGMHEQDLEWYLRSHPDSTLARLTHDGTTYRNAVTPFPSDSFPGMLAQVTGGDPRTTGVYYDDILRLLGVNPGELDAVRIQHTTALPR